MTADKNARNTRFISDKFIIRAGGRDKSGGEHWIIQSRDGNEVEEVHTTSSSAVILDRIVEKHSAALKRLAKK